MSTSSRIAASPALAIRPAPKPVHEFPGLRALAWQQDLLFASHAYTLLCANMSCEVPEWQTVGFFRPAWWRNLTASAGLSSRLFRDGFHALAALASGHFIAAAPGAIVSLMPGETEFRVSHSIQRGTRPLHITATPDGKVFWGEYFDNRDRDEVHIYVSPDRGLTWEVGYTFPKGGVRHVHNIVYDEWEDCLWILTGDEGAECRILRASTDFRAVNVVLAGGQQARAVALVPLRDAIYFATDTPLEQNHIYRLGRNGSLVKVADIDSSSICGCRAGTSIFFSIMAEPSRVNSSRTVKLYRSHDGERWEEFLHWRKDVWSMRLFQYGNAFLPDGQNTTDLLATSTVAVSGADLKTTLWRI
ncbi:MAG TPA: hypothetical protein VF011_13325 [Terriglobales bacterium]